MKDSENQELQARLYKKTYTIMILFALGFGLPAIISALVGKYFDDKYGVNPLRTLLFLGFSYIVGWFIVFVIYKHLKKGKKNV